MIKALLSSLVTPFRQSENTRESESNSTVSVGENSKGTSSSGVSLVNLLWPFPKDLKTSSTCFRIYSNYEVNALKQDYIELLSENMESEILEVSDDFFAEADNLINPKPPVAKPDTFTDKGAWYDGWESRRHNHLDHEYVIFKLKYPGSIKGVDMDCTTFNIGNSFRFGELEAAVVEGDEEPAWETIIPKSAITPNSNNFFCLRQPTTKYYNLLRLKAYPDGGLNRLRVYGAVRQPQPSDRSKPAVDLVFAGNGGKVAGCSNAHFSKPHNLLLPGRGENMGDGWETARSRAPDNSEWVILKLGAQGSINDVIIDTKDFKGNFPQKVEILAIDTPLEKPHYHRGLKWTRIAGGSLRPDAIVKFPIRQPHRNLIFTHLKVQIFPDGGLKRVRALGYFMADSESVDLPNKLQSATNPTGQEQAETESPIITPYNLRARRSLEYGHSSRKRKRRGQGYDDSVLATPIKTETPSPKSTRLGVSYQSTAA
ncbi:Allantoicase [Entomophthora muscae]|uniref:Allantoicase n=1 Tax=Entomophthora muscae TaxID=34485 RepID=A0ACC2TBP0_9FUNG|nr:Allantoicase [Entomophthora muscae]